MNKLKVLLNEDIELSLHRARAGPVSKCTRGNNWSRIIDSPVSRTA